MMLFKFFHEIDIQFHAVLLSVVIDLLCLREVFQSSCSYTPLYLGLGLRRSTSVVPAPGPAPGTAAVKSPQLQKRSDPTPPSRYNKYVGCSRIQERNKVYLHTRHTECKYINLIKVQWGKILFISKVVCFLYSGSQNQICRQNN